MKQDMKMPERFTDMDECERGAIGKGGETLFKDCNNVKSIRYRETADSDPISANLLFERVNYLEEYEATLSDGTILVRKEWTKVTHLTKTGKVLAGLGVVGVIAGLV